MDQGVRCGLVGGEVAGEAKGRTKGLILTYAVTISASSPIAVRSVSGNFDHPMIVARLAWRERGVVSARASCSSA